MLRPVDVAMRPFESVTLMVTAEVPLSDAAGVPVRFTLLLVLEARDSHEGPDTMDHVKGPIPPDSLIVALYAALMLAADSDVVVIEGAGTIVIESEADSLGKATDVAVTLAVVWVVTDVGAL
jgi:hypothetical protein